MMLKKWRWVVTAFLLTGLVGTAPVASGESQRAFRQENGLVAYDPPHWFLKGIRLPAKKTRTTFSDRFRRL